MFRTTIKNVKETTGLDMNAFGATEEMTQRIEAVCSTVENWFYSFLEDTLTVNSSEGFDGSSLGTVEGVTEV